MQVVLLLGEKEWKRKSGKGKKRKVERDRKRKEGQEGKSERDNLPPLAEA